MVVDTRGEGKRANERDGGIVTTRRGTTLQPPNVYVYVHSIVDGYYEGGKRHTTPFLCCFPDDGLACVCVHVCARICGRVGTWHGCSTSSTSSNSSSRCAEGRLRHRSYIILQCVCRYWLCGSRRYTRYVRV